MDAIEEIQVRLSTASRYAQIALACKCGERTLPNYEEDWEGDYYESVGRAIQLGWQFAIGDSNNDSEFKECLAEVKDQVDFYREEDISVVAAVVTVCLRILEAIGDDRAKAELAVPRALLSTLEVAQSAEAIANQKIPRSDRVKVAVLEEEDWQDKAMKLIENWTGVAEKNMFDRLGTTEPKWLREWRNRRTP